MAFAIEVQRSAYVEKEIEDRVVVAFVAKASNSSEYVERCPEQDEGA